MKLVTRIVFFLTLLGATFSIASEVLVCNVILSIPQAQNLKFIGQNGVRLISEKFEGASEGRFGSSKNFEIAIEELGSRYFSLVTRSDRPTSEAPLNVNFYVSKFDGDNILQVMEVDVFVESEIELKGNKTKYSNQGSLVCIKQTGDGRCIGNYSAGIHYEIDDPEYFGYSVFCKPI